MSQDADDGLDELGYANHRNRPRGARHQNSSIYCITDCPCDNCHCYDTCAETGKECTKFKEWIEPTGYRVQKGKR
jgi:hypothetical protein